jgi:DmsE family decaheme c-type cytochrome
VNRPARAGLVAAFAVLTGVAIPVFMGSASARAADAATPATPAAAPAAATPAAATPAAATPAAAPTASAYSPQGADTCLGCHNNPSITGIFHTKHARPNDPRGPFGHGGLQCEACHGPGGAHVSAGGGPPAGLIVFGSKSPTPVAQQNANCLGCHQSNAAHDWATSAHAGSNLACAGCHTLHAEKDPVQSATTQIEVCTGCHQSQHSDLLKPSHHPLREGKMTCTACHSPHGSTAPAQLVKNTVNETCTSCHAEYRGPYLWEHQPVTEDCTNCHEPHGSVQSSLLKMRPPFLCQTCHEGVGHPSIANTPRGLAGGMPSAYLLGGGCTNCHSQVHGSNSPSGRALMR